MARPIYQQKNGQFCLNDKQVIKIIDNSGNLRDRLIIELLANTGARREEVANLRVSDIDLKSGEIIVTGKGNKKRILWPPNRVIILLDTYLKYVNGKNKYLFPAKKKKGAAICPEVINRIVMQAGQAAGIKNPNPRLKHINPHSLRHSYARRLKAAGVPIDGIAAILGHSSVNTTIAEYGLIGMEELKGTLREVIG